jgi:hypothetical protein
VKGVVWQSQGQEGGYDGSLYIAQTKFYKISDKNNIDGRAVTQRLDAVFPPRLPGYAYGLHVGFVVNKAALGQVFSEYFGFPCQSFLRFLHYHNHPGLTQ